MHRRAQELHGSEEACRIDCHDRVEIDAARVGTQAFTGRVNERAPADALCAFEGGLHIDANAKISRRDARAAVAAEEVEKN